MNSAVTTTTKAKPRRARSKSEPPAPADATSTKPPTLEALAKRIRAADRPEPE